MKSATQYIYILREPPNGSIRYVGHSKQPAKRLVQHLTVTTTNPSLRSWIASLKALYTKPAVEVMCEIPETADVLIYERLAIRIIQRLTPPGQLLNIVEMQREINNDIDPTRCIRVTYDRAQRYFQLDDDSMRQLVGMLGYSENTSNFPSKLIVAVKKMVEDGTLFAQH